MITSINIDSDSLGPNMTVDDVEKFRACVADAFPRAKVKVTRGGGRTECDCRGACDCHYEGKAVVNNIWNSGAWHNVGK